MHWLGRHQDKASTRPLGAFLQAVVGLTTSQQEADFAAFQLPEEAPSRCSALGDQDHEHFSTSPVVGFLVDDLAAAVRELEAVGVELLGGQVDERRDGWRHFRAAPGAANRPVSAISWVPVRIDPSQWVGRWVDLWSRSTAAPWRPRCRLARFVAFGA